MCTFAFQRPELSGPPQARIAFSQVVECSFELVL